VGKFPLQPPDPLFSRFSRCCMSDYEETVSFVVGESALGIVVAEYRTDLVPAILQQLCPGDKQHLIVGNLKDAVAFGDWLQTAWLQTLVFSFQ